jgi:uncharacterized protein YndB with AHSA1/START domain
MKEPSAKHTTFVIEKHYKASPEKVYSAWADPDTKSNWFPKAETFEFRVGGHEINSGRPPGGPLFTYDACYQDIVPNSRIVYTYTMDMFDTRISVSVTTVELRPEDGGTKLIYTEQGVFLDGHDTPEQREHGTNILLDKLGEFVSSL